MLIEATTYLQTFSAGVEADQGGFFRKEYQSRYVLAIVHFRIEELAVSIQLQQGHHFLIAQSIS